MTRAKCPMFTDMLAREVLDGNEHVLLIQSQLATTNRPKDCDGSKLGLGDNDAAIQMLNCLSR